MKKVIKLSVLSMMAIFALASCGGDKKEHEHKEEPVVYDGAMDEELAPSQMSDPASATLSIESTDQMQYTKKELKAIAGTVTLTLKHTGQMEKAVMGHNLVILKPGTDISDFSLKAADAKATDYIPASEKANVIAHTKIIGGGESDTIEFTIEKGTYDFICSFPGHSAIMKGKLIVE